MSTLTCYISMCRRRVLHLVPTPPTRENPLESSTCLWSSSQMVFLGTLLGRLSEAKKEHAWGQNQRRVGLRLTPFEQSNSTFDSILLYLIYTFLWRMSCKAKRSLRITNKPNGLIFQVTKKMVFKGFKYFPQSLKSELDENCAFCFLTLNSISSLGYTLPPLQGLALLPSHRPEYALL